MLQPDKPSIIGGIKVEHEFKLIKDYKTQLPKNFEAVPGSSNKFIRIVFGEVFE